MFSVFAVLPALVGDMGSLDPFLLAVGIVFAVVLVTSASIYVFAERLPGWKNVLARAVRRFALPSAGIAVVGLTVAVLGLLGMLPDYGPIVGYVLLVTLFTLVGYAAYYFYRVYPAEAARWRAEEIRRQYMPRPKAHVVSRPTGKKRSHRRH